MVSAPVFPADKWVSKSRDHRSPLVRGEYVHSWAHPQRSCCGRSGAGAGGSAFLTSFLMVLMLLNRRSRFWTLLDHIGARQGSVSAVYFYHTGGHLHLQYCGWDLFGKAW